MQMRNQDIPEEQPELKWPAVTAGWTDVAEDLRLDPVSYDIAHHLEGKFQLVSPQIEELRDGNVRFIYNLVNGSFETTKHLNGETTEVLGRIARMQNSRVRVYIS